MHFPNTRILIQNHMRESNYFLWATWRGAREGTKVSPQTRMVNKSKPFKLSQYIILFSRNVIMKEDMQWRKIMAFEIEPQNLIRVRLSTWTNSTLVPCVKTSCSLTRLPTWQKSKIRVVLYVRLTAAIPKRRCAIRARRWPCHSLLYSVPYM